MTRRGPTPPAGERPWSVCDHALLALFAVALPAAAESSFSVEPVADLGLSPTVALHTVPHGEVRIGDRVVFFASDEVSSTELWATDGTQAGTRRVLDVSPSGGNPALGGGFGLVAARDRAFFETADPLAGGRLWVTDGSREGTVPFFNLGLYDELAGPPPAIQTAVLGRDLLFVRAGEGDAPELWRSNGTAAGTRRLASLPADSYFGVKGVGMIPAVGRVYLSFLSTDRRGQEFWVSDGTETGTLRLARFPFAANPSPPPPLAVGSRLFFVGFDADHGFEMWTSDGTSEGTRILRDVVPGRRGPFFGLFLAGRRNFYFTLSTQVARELWQSDGTEAGTLKLPTFDGSFVQPEGEVEGSLLFFEAGGFWRTRKGAAPRPLAPKLDGCGGEAAAVPFGGKLYLFAKDGQNSCRLWRTDGTPEGTQLAPDLGGDFRLRPLGSRLLLFSSGIPEIRVVENDRVSALRRPRAELRSGAPSNLVPWADGLAFAATGMARRAIFRSDGTAAGTLPIASGPLWSPYYTELPRDLIPLGENLVYWSPGGIESSNASLPGANPIHLGEHPVGRSLEGQALFSYSGRAFWLTLSSGGHDVDLHGTDGTTAGTGRVGRLFPAPVSPFGGVTYVPDFFVVRTEGYLAFFFPFDSNEIWTTDGTAAGTRRLFDLDEADDETGTRFLLEGVPFDDGMLFTTWGPQSGIQFWRTDDSPAGVSAIDRVTTISPPHRLTRVGSLVYFTADGPGGTELWVTDGTLFAVHRVRDIVPGPQGSFPRDLTAVGDRLFFTADDATSGREIWSSDGTTAGTARVADLAPGPEGSFPQRLAAVSLDGAPPFLAFAANDGVHGLEPWLGEADATGVRLLADVAPGRTSSSPGEFLAVGSRIFFAATTRSAGRELWVATLEKAGAPLLSCAYESLRRP
ncbi:MAG: ELWxxDGT repeat protein [Acidobacteriota bacterium]